MQEFDTTLSVEELHSEFAEYRAFLEKESIKHKADKDAFLYADEKQRKRAQSAQGLVFLYGRGFVPSPLQ